MFFDDKPEITVYTADTAPLYEKKLFDEIYSSVSAERREKTDGMRMLNDKCLSLGAEYLLMRACRDYGVDYGAAVIAAGKYSKPAFCSGKLQFNLSHSGTRAMCAVSFSDVGCDVEEIKPFKSAVAEKYFSPEEKRALGMCVTQPERENLFFRIWTLRESFMKCTGRGLALPLTEFSLTFENGRVSVNQTVDDSDYLFFEKDYSDGYKYSVCAKKQSEKDPFSITWNRIIIPH